MSEPQLELAIKRLHISGLTPSITPADLERRLSSFGKVKAMDGFGSRDALGDPRKFAFVTMEIGTKDLARCLNVLSGSTWKGAKLRIGEAKPDFQERLAQLNAQPPRPVRSKSTRSRSHGRPSSTLSLTPLSAIVAASTPGWIATPSGRVVRPMRMRPERPLGQMYSELKASKAKTGNGKVKKRAKLPPIRARRRLIDPTKWDSVYLKGVFLDALPVPLRPSKGSLSSPEYGAEDQADKSSNDGDASTQAQAEPRLISDHARTIQNYQQSSGAAAVTSSRTHEALGSIDIRDETNAALAMLGRMFGDKEDWDGRESVDAMEVVEGYGTQDKEMQVDNEDIKIVPPGFGEGSKNIKHKGKGKDKDEMMGNVHFSCEDEADVEPPDGENDSPLNTGVPAQIAKPSPQTNLKALFAPKENAPFSLADHLDLDLDLELDADILGISAPTGAPQENSLQISSAAQTVGVPAIKSTSKARSWVTLDPSLPLLFPLPDLLPYPHSPSTNPTTTNHRHGAQSCFLFPSATRVQGLKPLPSSINFTRSPQDTSETIRERWERDKISLTREWKKAWRDARGSRRGRGRAGDDTGAGF